MNKDLLIRQVLVELPLSFNMNMPGFHWLTLHSVCKELRDMFTKYAFPQFCSLINERLRERIDKNTANVLFANNHTLTGSFLLGCIYGRDYFSHERPTNDYETST